MCTISHNNLDGQNEQATSRGRASCCRFDDGIPAVGDSLQTLLVLIKLVTLNGLKAGVGTIGFPLKHSKSGTVPGSFARFATAGSMLQL